MPYFKEIVELVGLAVDGAGVLIIVLGMLAASVRFALPAARKAGDAYRTYRQDVGKAILLGLEFLVASDIIRTVAISPTLQSTGTPHMSATSLVRRQPASERTMFVIEDRTHCDLNDELEEGA